MSTTPREWRRPCPAHPHMHFEGGRMFSCVGGAYVGIVWSVGEVAMNAAMLAAELEAALLDPPLLWRVTNAEYNPYDEWVRETSFLSGEDDEA